MSKEKVIEICGDFPEGYVSKDYSSDPNFTFPKDLNQHSFGILKEILLL